MAPGSVCCERQSPTGVMLSLFSHWTSPLAYEAGTAHCTGEEVKAEGVQELSVQLLVCRLILVVSCCGCSHREPISDSLGDIFNNSVSNQHSAILCL